MNKREEAAESKTGNKKYKAKYKTEELLMVICIGEWRLCTTCSMVIRAGHLHLRQTPIREQITPMLDFGQNIVNMDVWCNTPADLMAQAATLNPGEQLFEYVQLLGKIIPTPSSSPLSP